jgi:K+-transporting ATPase A subunit
MASVWMFGRIAKRMLHAHVVFVVMLLLLVGLVGYANYCEQQPAVALNNLPSPRKRI